MHPIPFALSGFAVTEVISTEEKLIICATSQAPCPVCQQISSRVHSYYQRSPRDLPICGQAVQLRQRVRRFRWLNAQCTKKTFAEPLPDLIGSTARRTHRLTLLWSVFALHSGGEPGARLRHQQSGRLSVLIPSCARLKTQPTKEVIVASRFLPSMISRFVVD